MQKLNIKITKAQLTGYYIQFDEEGRINVKANISLFTEDGRQVTTHQISTDAWNKNDKFELPLNCYEPIMNMGVELERVVTKHFQDPMMGLEAPKSF